jgi:retron-type reverse transcriptase
MGRRPPLQAYYPQFLVLPGEKRIFIKACSKRPSKSATNIRRTMRAGVAQGGLLSPLLFRLYVNDMPTPSLHVELALYADETALIATSRSPLPLVRYV